MNKIEELSSYIIGDVNKVLKIKNMMDEEAFDRIISDFVLLARVYNSQYKMEPYDLFHRGYDFLKLDLLNYLGFDSCLFRVEQRGNNLTLMFGQEAILAVRNVIFDRFSNEFLISCAEKFNLPPIRLDFVMSKNYIFGCNETLQNAGDHSFISTIDYLEGGQRNKIEEFKYVYCVNDYCHPTIMIDRINGIRIKSTTDTFEIFDFDTRYLDNPIDFPISGRVEEIIAKLTNVRKVVGAEVSSSDESVSFTKKFN